MGTASQVLGSKSACFAAIVACALGLTYCGGDSAPAGQCTDGEGVCDGDIAKQCTAGAWEVKQDCSKSGKACKLVGTTAGCFGSSVTLDSGTTPLPDTGTTPFPDTGTTPFPDTGTVTNPDTGVVRPEGGIVILPDGSTVTPDSGIVTFPDSSTVTPDSGTTALSCVEVIQCLNACASGDQTCANNCIASGTPEAQQQIQAVAQCVSTAFSGACSAACGDPASAACNTCLETECAAEMNTCLGGTTTPTMSCDQVLQCISGCGGDATCETNCVNQGTPTAQQQLQTMAQCINTAATGTCSAACADPASAACNTCLETECSAEIAACTGGTIPTGLSCLEVLQCMNGCASGDQACLSQCVASGTTAAQQQVQAIATCVQTAVAGTCATACVDPSSAACDTCLETECTAELTACTGGPTTGTMTCDQVVTCISGCGSDQICFDNCVNQGTPTAQQQLQAMAQCINTAGSGICATACADPASAACNTCLETECTAEITACMGTP